MKFSFLFLAILAMGAVNASAQTTKPIHAAVTEDPYKSETPLLLDCVKTAVRKFIKANIKNSDIKLDIELDEIPENPFLQGQKSCTKLGCDDLIQGTDAANFKVKANIIQNKTKVQTNYLGCTNVYIVPSKNLVTGQIEKYYCSINVDYDNYAELDYSDTKQMQAIFNQILDSKQVAAKATAKQFGNVNYKCGK